MPLKHIDTGQFISNYPTIPRVYKYQSVCQVGSVNEEALSLEIQFPENEHYHKHHQIFLLDRDGKQIDQVGIWMEEIERRFLGITWETEILVKKRERVIDALKRIGDDIEGVWHIVEYDSRRSNREMVNLYNVHYAGSPSLRDFCKPHFAKISSTPRAKDLFVWQANRALVCGGCNEVISARARFCPKCGIAICSE